jgi:hypothetical protein
MRCALVGSGGGIPGDDKTANALAAQLVRMGIAKPFVAR